MRVLIVDDNQDIVDSLKTVLEISGFEVAVAYNGVEAIEAARKLLPEAVILDIGLPHLDGYYVARTLRADANLNKVKLIAVTGYGSEHDKAQAASAGFDHHLVKPANPAKIMEILSRQEPSD